jgi:hypothetical protein
MKYIGALVIGVLTSMLGINVLDSKGIIDLRDTIALICFLWLWFIICSLIEKKNTDK